MPTPAQHTRCMVEVVACGEGIHFSRRMPVPAQQTLGWAVNASGLFALHPKLQGAKLGVWGQVLPPATVVQPHDRIEVYLPVLPAAVQAHRAHLQKFKKPMKAPSDA